MQITYDVKTDLLYMRLDEKQQQVINKRLSDDVVLDIGNGEKIVGIEILDASKRPNLSGLLPMGNYRGFALGVRFALAPY